MVDLEPDVSGVGSERRALARTARHVGHDRAGVVGRPLGPEEGNLRSCGDQGRERGGLVPTGITGDVGALYQSAGVDGTRERGTHGVVAVGDWAIVYEGAGDALEVLLRVLVRVPRGDVVVANFELLHEAVSGGQADERAESEDQRGELHRAVRVRGGGSVEQGRRCFIATIC